MRSRLVLCEVVREFHFMTYKNFIANAFFMIVQRKVLKAAQMFVSSVKGKRQGKNIDQK
jgi:hypothetical protein